jgi:hypothetical protein
MGPQESMTRAAAAAEEWKPKGYFFRVLADPPDLHNRPTRAEDTR